jgi:hypothetical protein
VFPLMSASPTGTRQIGSLYRVPLGALGRGTSKRAHGRLLCRALVQHTIGKEGAFDECQGRHSAKILSPSLGVVMETFICRVPCRVPDKKYSTKKSLSIYSSSRLLYRESISKAFIECFPGFIECLKHSRKKMCLIVYFVKHVAFDMIVKKLVMFVRYVGYVMYVMVL